ncbi:hypothetical protein NLX83_39515 [Allokutzneria sp. A3M-2-11 16]|uniref:hypothetical protein n=1 Tax=Allokutzneria sp. A3M-2-11 16 TaxID=2962043 RepID=UPI0020B8C988|nr:hypothetical protein [Allokutzneria sp. A3M-2-11 16]MCP3805373.1 hypothetical protein [Allokutzneria sp. A3M-2-11 16]
MVVKVEIRGTQDFIRAARRFRQAGRGELTRTMAKEMKTAAAPVQRAAQASVSGLEIVGEKSTARAGGRGGARARELYALRRTKSARSVRVWRRARARSGLRATIARAVKTTVRTGGTTASVRLHVNNSLLPADQRTLPGYLNEGKWRHPVFGKKKTWVGQKAPPGWWDEVMQREGPTVRRSAMNVVRKFLNKLV